MIRQLSSTFKGEIYILKQGESLSMLVDKFGFDTLWDLVHYHNLYCKEADRIHPLFTYASGKELFLPKYEVDLDRIHLAQHQKAKTDPSFGEQPHRRTIPLNAYNGKKKWQVDHAFIKTISGQVEKVITKKEITLEYVRYQDPGHLLSLSIENKEEDENPLFQAASLLTNNLYPFLIRLDAFGHIRGIELYNHWLEAWQERKEHIRSAFSHRADIERLIEHLETKVCDHNTLEAYMINDPIWSSMFFPVHRDYQVVQQMTYPWYLPELGTIEFEGDYTVSTNENEHHIQYDATWKQTERSNKQLESYLEKNNLHHNLHHNLKHNLKHNLHHNLIDHNLGRNTAQTKQEAVTAGKMQVITKIRNKAFLCSEKTMQRELYYGTQLKFAETIKIKAL